MKSVSSILVAVLSELAEISLADTEDDNFIAIILNESQFPTKLPNLSFDYLIYSLQNELLDYVDELI